MSNSSIIAAFRQRKLELNFLEMSLVQDKPYNCAISYSGKGYIRQTADDVLTFKLYANETRNTDLVTDFNSLNKLRSGEIIKAEDRYTLTGLALDGSEWRAERILPYPNWFGPHPNPVVCGNLRACMSGDQATDASALELHFFENADLPVMTDEKKFTADDREFRIHKGDESFSISAKSNTPLPLHFEVRVVEALCFLLAQSVTPRVFVQRGSLKLMSAAPRSPRTALRPPIGRGSPEFIDRSWELFVQYLRYVIRETEHPYWNPCTAYIYNAIEASANSWDAWAIGLCVAVEGLAAMLDMERDKEETKKLKSLRDFIIDQVENHEEHSVFARRIIGLLGGLTSIRAIDRMIKLTEQGGTDPSYVDAWKQLRNPSVHPMIANDDDSSSDSQLHVDRLLRVNVLLYHIVFYLIGYSGPYTDYGARDFPIKNYPLVEAPNSLKDHLSLS